MGDSLNLNPSRRGFLRGIASASLGAAGLRGDTEEPPVDIGALSVEEKVGQLLLLAFEGATARDAEVLLGKHYVGGVYLSQDNLQEPDQAVGLLTELQQIGAGTPHKLPIFSACDQEGAWSVLNPRGTRGPGNLALGATPPSQVEAMYTVFGRELQALGVSGDLAPVADVNANPLNPIIGTRSFGQDPQRVAAAVAAAVRGLHAGGARACAKHFPGHGDTAQDSHRELAIVNRSPEQIRNSDLVPFRAAIAAGVDIVMTAHLRYPAFDSEWPATLSPAILEKLLRKELGFKGVILTDSFSMGAIRNVYGTAEAAVRAINAGADMVMLAEERYGNESSGYLSRQVALIGEIRRAVRDGKIPMARVDESVGRVLKLKVAAQLFTRGNPSLEEAQRVVGSKLNRDVALEAARAAVLVARNLDSRIPLMIRDDRMFMLVSPIGQNAYGALRRLRGIGPNITEPPGDVLFREIKRRNPAAEMVRIAEPRDVGPRLDQLRAASAVIVATENYPLPGFDFPTKPQREVIETMMAGGIQPILVGLRDPYELLDLTNVRSYVAALGYAPICAQAAAEVLFGERIPVGKMPVSV